MTKNAITFDKIATSFYGCDGGNLASDYWFCGLEWGKTITSLPIPHIVDDYGYDDITPKTRNFMENISWKNGFHGAVATGYNQKICWFFNYLSKSPLEKIPCYQDFVKKNKICYNEPNGLGFKMNLFPLNFPKHNQEWNEEIHDYTKLNNRVEYEEWCITHRAAFFMPLIYQYQPAFIICTGKTAQDKFFNFFNCQDTPSLIKKENEIEIQVRTIPQTQTQVIVVPFFGNPSGINSFEKMKILTTLITSLAPSPSYPELLS